jgi:hypothetical protein
VSTFDFVRSAASETALRKILFPPKMMNCLEGLTLRSRGAAERTPGKRSRPHISKRKRQLEVVVLASNASPARALWGQRASCPLIAAGYQAGEMSLSPTGKMPVLPGSQSSPLHVRGNAVIIKKPVYLPTDPITSTLKGISENYGKIERFLSATV